MSLLRGGDLLCFRWEDESRTLDAFQISIVGENYKIEICVVDGKNQYDDSDQVGVRLRKINESISKTYPSPILFKIVLRLLTS